MQDEQKPELSQREMDSVDESAPFEHVVYFDTGLEIQPPFSLEEDSENDQAKTLKMDMGEDAVEMSYPTVIYQKEKTCLMMPEFAMKAFLDSHGEDSLTIVEPGTMDWLLIRDALGDLPTEEQSDAEKAPNWYPDLYAYQQHIRRTINPVTITEQDIVDITNHVWEVGGGAGMLWWTRTMNIFKPEMVYDKLIEEEVDILLLMQFCQGVPEIDNTEFLVDFVVKHLFDERPEDERDIHPALLLNSYISKFVQSVAVDAGRLCKMAIEIGIPELLLAALGRGTISKPGVVTDEILNYVTSYTDWYMLLQLWLAFPQLCSEDPHLAQRLRSEIPVDTEEDRANCKYCLTNMLHQTFGDVDVVLGMMTTLNFHPFAMEVLDDFLNVHREYIINQGGDPDLLTETIRKFNSTE